MSHSLESCYLGGVSHSTGKHWDTHNWRLEFKPCLEHSSPGTVISFWSSSPESQSCAPSTTHSPFQILPIHSDLHHFLEFNYVKRAFLLGDALLLIARRKRSFCKTLFPREVLFSWPSTPGRKDRRCADLVTDSGTGDDIPPQQTGSFLAKVRTILAPSSPGLLRGLNKIMNKGMGTGWQLGKWQQWLFSLAQSSDPRTPPSKERKEGAPSAKIRLERARGTQQLRTHG